MKNSIPKMVWYAGSVLVSCSLSINAFFVKGLLDEIKEHGIKVTRLDKRLAVLESKIDGFVVRQKQGDINYESGKTFCVGCGIKSVNQILSRQ